MRILHSDVNGGASVTTTVTTKTVIRTSAYASRKTLSPSARSRMDRFYDQIDWVLGAEEREARRRAKKARRNAKRRLKKLLKAAGSGDAKRRAEAQTRIIDLLGGKEAGNA